jgi:hypothetical protein
MNFWDYFSDEAKQAVVQADWQPTTWSTALRAIDPPALRVIDPANCGGGFCPVGLALAIDDLWPDPEIRYGLPNADMAVRVLEPTERAHDIYPAVLGFMRKWDEGEIRPSDLPVILGVSLGERV